VVMQSGLGESERITYTAKVPYGDGSLDVITSAPVADFPNFRPLYDRILLSLQRATSE